jgi:hypothetical protein
MSSPRPSCASISTSISNGLRDVLGELRPHVLVLDPLVRLHRLDENSASDISRLLGFLRELQRAFDLAVVLVHHASKKHRAQPGQTLRGSSDLHAFGDSNAYLARDGDRLVLTLEHRAAKPPEPLTLQLVSEADGSGTHLAVIGGAPIAGAAGAAASLAKQVVAALRASQTPLSRAALRAQLKVNNQRLGDALTELEKRCAIERDGRRVALRPRRTTTLPAHVGVLRSAPHGGAGTERRGVAPWAVIGSRPVPRSGTSGYDRVPQFCAQGRARNGTAIRRTGRAMPRSMQRQRRGGAKRNSSARSPC